MTDIFKFEANEKKIHLELDIDPEIPSTISSDRERIKQILLNLMFNSMKFTFLG